MSVTGEEPLIKSGLEGCIARVTEKVMKVKHGVCSLDFFLCKVSRIEWNLKRISGCAGWNRISVGNGRFRKVRTSQDGIWKNPNIISLLGTVA